MNKTLQQKRDLGGVMAGAVHNIGAGGVGHMKHIVGPFGHKRFAQYLTRTARAAGVRHD